MDSFCEGDWTTCMKLNTNLEVFVGGFHPVSNESANFDTDNMLRFDNFKPLDIEVVFDVFLN